MARLIPSPLYNPDFEHDACGVGFIAKITGGRSHDVIRRALAALKGLSHRGAIDADAVTGDGAGILTQIPTTLLRSHLAKEEKMSRPIMISASGSFSFRAKTKRRRRRFGKSWEQAVAEKNLNFLCWRSVPVAKRASRPISTWPTWAGMLSRINLFATDEHR